MSTTTPQRGRTAPAAPPTPPAPADNLGPYIKARIAELSNQLNQARQDHADIQQQIEGLKLARQDARAVINQLQGRIAELQGIGATTAPEATPAATPPASAQPPAGTPD